MKTIIITIVILFAFLSNTYAQEKKLAKAVKNNDIEKIHKSIKKIDEERLKNRLSNNLFWSLDDNPTIEVLETLVDLGADVNYVGWNNQSPLTFGCKNSSIKFEVIEFLLKNGANANYQETVDRIVNNHFEEKDGSYTFQIEKANLGRNALYYAITNKREDIVKILLDSIDNPDLKIYDNSVPKALTGYSPLKSSIQDATEKGKPIQLNLGSDYYILNNNEITTNKKPTFGYTTPLFESIKIESVPIFKLLISKGAGANYDNNIKEEIIDFSKTLSNKELVELIKTTFSK